ncbi:ATP-binding protein [Coraliomargarita sp. W4R53]
MPLEDGWHYRWGDSPISNGVPEWTQDGDNLAWLPIEFPSDPPFREGQNNVWYRYHLPAGKLPGNSLYIFSVDLIVEIYLEDQLIYHYGTFAADGSGSFEGWPWHLIDLPHDSAGKDLYFRIYSDYSDIGLWGEISLGSEYAHLQHIIRRDLLPLTVGLIFITCGIAMILSNLICWRTPILIMGVFMLNLGFIPIQESQIKQLIFFNPVFWQFFGAGGYFFLPITMAGLVHALYGRGIWRIHQLVWMLHLVFFIAAITLSSTGVINLSSFYLYFDVLAFISTFGLSIALSISAIRGEANQRILALGLWLFYTVMVYNGLTAHGILPLAPRSEYLGPLLLGACFLVILIRHYTSLSRGLQNHSRELEIINANLEQMVEERTDALQTLNRSKDQFFAIIAHDLKSPIGAQLHLLQDYEQNRVGIPTKDIPELRKSCQKTYNLLTRLLTWARGQQGQLRTNRETIAARGLVESVLVTMRAQAAAKHIDLRCIPYDEPLVFADIEMLSTVFRNLISNAIKFTPPGGWVRVEIKQEPDRVRFSFTDNGIGLNEDAIDGLFLPKDYESIRTDTEGEKGSGLGLLLCKEFIEAHQGEISEETPEAGGTCIWFTIPNLQTLEL